MEGLVRTRGAGAASEGSREGPAGRVVEGSSYNTIGPRARLRRQKRRFGHFRSRQQSFFSGLLTAVPARRIVGEGDRHNHLLQPRLGALKGSPAPLRRR